MIGIVKKPPQVLLSLGKLNSFLGHSHGQTLSVGSRVPRSVAVFSSQGSSNFNQDPEQFKDDIKYFGLGSDPNMEKIRLNKEKFHGQYK